MPVLFIVGPTATGKTRLAVALAQLFHGEIINADSRQVYRRMDIGTAKPTPEQRSQAPHHLLDILDPDQDFSLGAFLPLARAAIEDIQARGRLPIVAGGTGQYVWALQEGWQVPAAPPDPEFRRARERQAERQGPLAVYRELQQVDPSRAAQLDPRNVRRVIRALEIYHTTRRRPSDYRQQGGPLSDTLIIGLALDRQELYRRIDQRVDEMLELGLLAEVRRLEAMGYRLGRGPLASPGYRELGQHLRGEIYLEEATQRTRFQTHRLARRQHTWFKADDPRIQWLDAADPRLLPRAARMVDDFLSGRISCGTIAWH